MYADEHSGQPKPAEIDDEGRNVIYMRKRHSKSSKYCTSTSTRKKTTFLGAGGGRGGGSGHLAMADDIWGVSENGGCLTVCLL